MREEYSGILEGNRGVFGESFWLCCHTSEGWYPVESKSMHEVHPILAGIIKLAGFQPSLE
jgi:hypothetical protein